jgi:hypothetical protein
MYVMVFIFVLNTLNTGLIPSTRSTVKIVNGLFNETLEPFLRRNIVNGMKKISFVNMDMDLYSGAYYVLERIIPHLSSGAVIHFHDFFNSMTNCHSDEMRALYVIMFNHSEFGMTKDTSFQLQFMPYETVGFREPLVFRFL